MKRATAIAMLLIASCAVPCPADDSAVAIKVTPADAKNVSLVESPDGSLAYRVVWNDGREEMLKPDAFAAILYQDQRTRGWAFAVLNITTPWGIAWVALGFMGQILFTGRMVIQWLVSEKNKRSVIPTAFWWMSLIGATMLIAYFLWRKDIVGVLGQATGWLIYVRNLVLIHRHARPLPDPAATDAADAAAQ